MIAYGHNLTRATRMVLIKPDYSPSTESQTHKRIHRLGQSQPRWVTRIVCKAVRQEQQILHIQELRMEITKGTERAEAREAETRENKGLEIDGKEGNQLTNRPYMKKNILHEWVLEMEHEYEHPL